MEKTYNIVLTVILCICIGAILVLLGIWGVDAYNNYKINSDAKKAIEDFEKMYGIYVNETRNNQNENNKIIANMTRG